MSVSWSIHRHLSNLQTESAAFFALVLQALVMVFLLWEEGLVWQDLRACPRKNRPLEFRPNTEFL